VTVPADITAEHLAIASSGAVTGWLQALAASSDKACACAGAGASNAQQRQIDAK
jgi:hypothetical protein